MEPNTQTADFVALLEAILFFKAEPMSIKKLGKLLEVNEAAVEMGLTKLKERLVGRGVMLLEKDGEVTLGTVPEAGSLIEKMRREELAKDIGKAGLETLSIILYRGPISRGRIDYIRGVNSAFIVRNLLVRGLVERVPNPGRARGFLYRPTFDLLSFLGVAKVEDLPEYKTANEELNNFEKETNTESEDGESANPHETTKKDSDNVDQQI